MLEKNGESTPEVLCTFPGKGLSRRLGRVARSRVAVPAWAFKHRRSQLTLRTREARGIPRPKEMAVPVVSAQVSGEACGKHAMGQLAGHLKFQVRPRVRPSKDRRERSICGARHCSLNPG